MADENSKPDEIQKQELGKIVSWLKTLKFKKKLFGGVNEADVWKKMDELNKMYEQVFEEERLRYDLLLEERIQQYQQQVKERLAKQFNPREGR